MSTHQTVFSPNLRVLACANCGAPVEGTIAGGTVQCTYCGTSNTLSARDESRDRAAAAVAPTMTEAQRFERLRAQDGKPLLPPPALQHLLVGGGLPPQNMPAAQNEWRRARQEVAQGGGFASAERLYFLTMLIYGPLAKMQQDQQVRAMLETALDHLTEPRHRQVIHGMLARNAARVGDVAAAEQWLALCTPYSDDIHMDSGYRFSRAYVSTAKGDYNTVLQTLGARVDDMPIADGQDEVCGVLRANAYERLGQAQTAVEQLVQLMTGHPAGPQLVQQIVAANPNLQLCAHSFPLAQQQRQQMAASAVRTRGGFKFGCLFWPLFLGGFGLAGAINLANSLLNAQYLPFITAGLIGGYMVLVVGMLVFTIGRGMKIKSKLRQSGVMGRAKVLAANQTGVRVNEQPQVQFQLMVNVPGRQPYTAIHSEIVSAMNLGRIGAGGELAVRVDANDPSLMMIDWQQA